MSALLASHRYALLFDGQGNFHVEDVPPGEYRITGFIASADPASLSFSRRFVGKLDAEIAVPKGTGPFDAGVIKAPPVEFPNRK